MKRELEAQGASVLVFSTIELAPPPDESIILRALAELDTFNWIIFTSANAVERFFSYLSLRERGSTPPVLGSSEIPHMTSLPLRSGRSYHLSPSTRVAVVGPSTAEALQQYGVTPDLMPEKDYQAEGLIEAFETLPTPVKGERVLIPRALHAREILPDALSKMGYELTVAPVYETRPATPDPDALAALPTVDAYVFTSPSTARNFVRIVNNAEMDALPLLTGSEVFSIGLITTAELRELGLPADAIHEPPQATTQALINLIQSF